MRFLASFRSQRSIAGGAAVLAVTSFLASALGFFRDQAFSVMFPPGADALGVASVYIAAFRPSDLLFQLTVMSCLSVVMVPFLASHLAREKREEMNRVLVSTITIFGILFCVLAGLIALTLPRIAPSLVHFTGAQLDLYIRFARIALLTNALFVFGNAFGQYLIAEQRYWVYGLTPIAWSFGTILGTYLLSPFFGADGPILGTLLGTVVYVFWRLRAIHAIGFRWQLPRGALLHADLRGMGLMIVPRMLALGALQLQLLLLDRFATALPSGVLALNQFARNFESVVPGVIGIAIAQSSFSLLSQSSARGDAMRLQRHLWKGTMYNLVLSVPGAITLAIAAPLAAWLLRIPSEVTGTFVSLLMLYAIAVPFESVSHIFLRGFYAQKNTAIPAVTTVLSAAAAVGIAGWGIRSFGGSALALGYVVGQIVQAVLLGVGLILKPLSGSMAASQSASEVVRP